MPKEIRAQRRLAAIVAADFAGYSRPVGLDEEGTLAAMRAHRRELIDPLLDEHSGRVANTAGDSFLLEFPSVVDAVRCTVALQDGLAIRNKDVAQDRRMELRIGVNLGDVIADDGDLLGDGVNIAARLETLCQPGGLMLSDDAFRQVRDRLEIAWVDGGEQEVKNIARPVRVWQWSPNSSTLADPMTIDAPLALPDKPSIAVLPFDNMSGDPEQKYFADGIAEDVITALSRFRSLFVIARNSSFTYKGGAVDIAQVSRELGVRYVVEGSVRKARDRVRITAQLIDAAIGNHLWADYFDGTLDDVFDLQDQITEQIVVAVEPEIGAHERQRARRKPPESLSAWELVHRGLPYSSRVNDADNQEAIRLFRQATTLDPEFATAHAHLAFALFRSAHYRYAEDVEEAAASARAIAEQAIALDPSEPEAHYVLGRLHLLARTIEMAISEMQTSIAINPNFVRGHYGLGYTYHRGAGQAELALPHYETALRLGPRDPWRWTILANKGLALRFLGRHDEAIATGRAACQFPDAGHLAYMNLAGSLAEAGQVDEAQLTVEKAMQIEPILSIGLISSRYASMHQTILDNLLDGLRKAGVPE